MKNERGRAGHSSIADRLARGTMVAGFSLPLSHTAAAECMIELSRSIAATDACVIGRQLLLLYCCCTTLDTSKRCWNVHYTILLAMSRKLRTVLQIAFQPADLSLLTNQSEEIARYTFLSVDRPQNKYIMSIYCSRSELS